MESDISVDDFLHVVDTYVPIDVRSPIEFQEGALLGAKNIPLFTNSERSEIGTIYKRNSSEAAKWRAMEIVSTKLPSILAAIKEVQNDGKTPLIYCWRGGMRSKAVTTFAAMAGIAVKRLEGGYRAYREMIVANIPALIPEKAIILYGMTGTGKTAILRSLKQRGFPVLDLEAYANHKGSLFGAIDGHLPNNQKKFDALLFHDLLRLRHSPYFIMEGESKRIGRAIQPEQMLSRRKNAAYIIVTGSLETRVERIYEEYVVGNEDNDQFIENMEYVLTILKKRIKQKDTFDVLCKYWQEKKYKSLIQLLITEYYDPRYKNAFTSSFYEGIEVNSDNIEQATEAIAAYLTSIGVSRIVSPV